MGRRLNYLAFTATVYVDPFAPTTQFLDFLSPPTGLVVPLVVPSDGSFCGFSFYLQAVQFDPGAGFFLYSFTAGLALTVGS